MRALKWDLRSKPPGRISLVSPHMHPVATVTTPTLPYPTPHPHPVPPPYPSLPPPHPTPAYPPHPTPAYPPPYPSLPQPTPPYPSLPPPTPTHHQSIIGLHYFGKPLYHTCFNGQLICFRREWSMAIYFSQRCQA